MSFSVCKIFRNLRTRSLGRHDEFVQNRCGATSPIIDGFYPDHRLALRTAQRVYVQSSAILYSKFQKTKGKCIMRKPIKWVLLWLYCVIPLVNMHRKLSIYHAKRTLHIYRYLYSYTISHI